MQHRAKECRSFVGAGADCLANNSTQGGGTAAGGSGSSLNVVGSSANELGTGADCLGNNSTQGGGTRRDCL